MIDDKKLIEWIEGHGTTYGESIPNSVGVDRLINKIQNREFEQKECSECENEKFMSEVSAWTNTFYKNCRFCGCLLGKENKDGK